MIDVRWVWLFLDGPATDAPDSWRFWSTATRWSLSSVRGGRGEFATLLPAEGDPWVKVQATGGGGQTVHLDLDVEDARAAAEVAKGLGAVEVATIGEPESVVVLRSPGGLAFCLTTWRGASRQVREGAADLIDQVCIDLPEDQHDAEIGFWAALTGWEHAASDVPEFSYLRRPDGIPVRLLFQRLGEPTGPARAHVDIACVDRADVTRRHIAAGAEVVDVQSFWTVLRDPVGRIYCLTDRPPNLNWVVRD